MRTAPEPAYPLLAKRSPRGGGLFVAAFAASGSPSFLWQATDLPKHTTRTGKAFIYASSFVFTASWFYRIARLVSEMAKEANF